MAVPLDSVRWRRNPARFRHLTGDKYDTLKALAVPLGRWHEHMKMGDWERYGPTCAGIHPQEFVHWALAWNRLADLNQQLLPFRQLFIRNSWCGRPMMILMFCTRWSGRFAELFSQRTRRMVTGWFPWTLNSGRTLLKTTAGDAGHARPITVL